MPKGGKELNFSSVLNHPLTQILKTAILQHFEDEVSNRSRDECNVIIFKFVISTQDKK